jgi:hypothetical protein
MPAYDLLEIGRPISFARAVMYAQDRFMHGGRRRYVATLYRKICTAVHAEFAERLAQASFIERLRPHVAMGREVRRRRKATVSSNARY